MRVNMRIKERIKSHLYRTVSLLLCALGRNKQALSCMDRLVNEGEAPGEKDWWTLGYLQARENQWEQAALAFAHAVKASNGHPRYIYWLGRANEETGHSGTAARLYDEALRKDALLWEALASQGEIKLRAKAYREALSYYQECLKLKPHDPRILNGAGACCLALDEPEKACEYLERATRLNPDDMEARYNYAAVCLQLGDLPQAIREFKKIRVENNADVLSMLGYCYGVLQDYDNSLKHYRAALAVESDSAEILLNIATIYAKSGDTVEALAIFKELLLKNPQNPELLNNIAWVYENREDYVKAEGLYYRGLAVSSGNPEIAYNLICCLKRQRKFLEALDMIEYLRKLPEWQRIAMAVLAHIYEGLGASRLAVDCYNRALGLD